MKAFADYKSGAMKRLQDRCKELNVTGHCNDSCGQNVIDLDTPTGFIFTATQTHMLNNWSYTESANIVAEALLLDLTMGIEPCEELDCDYCKEQNETAPGGD